MAPALGTQQKVLECGEVTIPVRRAGRRLLRRAGPEASESAPCVAQPQDDIALIGVLTGNEGEIPTTRLMAKQARLQGLIVGSRDNQKDLVRALNVNGIKPVIDKTFKLDELADAFRYEEAGKHFGKICISF